MNDEKIESERIKRKEEFEKLEEMKNKVEKLKRESRERLASIGREESTAKRKKRAKTLIKKGLLFEFANLQNIPIEILLGYLMEFEKHKDNEYYLNNLSLKGKTKFLEKRFKYQEEENK